MTKIRKLLLVGLLMLVAGLASAQIDMESYYDYYQIKEFSTQLQLDSNQLNQLDAIQQELQDFYTAQREIPREDITEEVMAERMAEYEKIQAAAKEKYKAVLTPSQQDKYASLKKEQIIETEARILENRKAGFKTEFWLALELTDEQVDQLIAVEEELNEELAAGSHSNGYNYQAVLKERYKTVLTEEQYTTYEEQLAEEARKKKEKTIQEMDRYIPAVEEIVAYFEQESYPAYQQLRTRLESKIEASDRSFLDGMRTQLETLYERILDEELGRGPGMEYMNDPEIMSRLDRFRDNIERALNMYVVESLSFMVAMQAGAGEFDEEVVMELSKKYNADIDALQEELKALKKVDMDKELTILNKYMSEFESRRLVESINRSEDMMGMRPDENLPDYQKNILRNISFLLMRPTEKSLEGAGLANARKSFSVYPSPSAGQHTLELNLLAEDQISVELLDANGKVLKSVYSGTLTEGQHLMPFNWSQQTGTLFYYRISGKHGVETVKFLISK